MSKEQGWILIVCVANIVMILLWMHCALVDIARALR